MSKTKEHLMTLYPDFPEGPQPEQPDDREIENIEWMGIDWHDAPDFVDAYICQATWSDTGGFLTEEEIEAISDNDRYEYLQRHLY